MKSPLVQLAPQIVPAQFVVQLATLRERFERCLRGLPISVAYIYSYLLTDGLAVLLAELEAHAPTHKPAPKNPAQIVAQIFRVPSPPRGAQWVREQGDQGVATRPPAAGKERRVSEGYARIPAMALKPEVIDAIDAAGARFTARLGDTALSRSAMIREALSRGISRLGAILEFSERQQALSPGRPTPLQELFFTRDEGALQPSRRGRPPRLSPMGAAALETDEVVPYAGTVFVPSPPPDFSQVDPAQWGERRVQPTPAPEPEQTKIAAKAKARKREVSTPADASLPQTHARARRSKRTTKSTQDGDGDPDPVSHHPPHTTAISLRRAPLELDDNLRHLLDFLVEKALSS